MMDKAPTIGIWQIYQDRNRHGVKIGGRWYGTEGEKSKEWIKAKSEARMEDMGVAVNLVVASCIKIDNGGGSRSSDKGIEEAASSTRCSEPGNNLVQSADLLSCHRWPCKIVSHSQRIWGYCQENCTDARWLRSLKSGLAPWERSSWTTSKQPSVRMVLTTACASTTPCLFVLIHFLLCRFSFLFCLVCSCLLGWIWYLTK